MASEKTSRPDEAFEKQDQSIKSRKSELFVERGEVGASRPFREYVERTSPAPLSPVVKGAIWGVGALVVLLLLAALLIGPAPKRRRPRAEAGSGRVAGVAWGALQRPEGSRVGV